MTHSRSCRCGGTGVYVDSLGDRVTAYPCPGRRTWRERLGDWFDIAGDRWPVVACLILVAVISGCIAWQVTA